MTVTGGAAVVHPTTTRDVELAVQDAIGAREPMAIRGAGSWQHAGASVDPTRVLSLNYLSGIVAYVPGDLTLTARAGTSLAELSHATAAHGQWLGLDPAGHSSGTIGATIATASSGPLSHAFGTPRDLVLGLEAVTGYGECVRPGGRVVKNVAGFDLVRLFTGSWGTLGPITSVSLRLRALPVHEVTMSVAVDGQAHLGTLIAALRANTVSLLACEWIDAITASALGVGHGTDVVLVRVGGNDAFVQGQRARLASAGDVTVHDAGAWRAIATLDDGASAVVRFSGAVATLPSRIARLREVASRRSATVAMHATISRGVVRLIVRDGVEALRECLTSTEADEQHIAEHLPSAWWADEPDPFTGGLAGRIRDAFDPHHLCNRRQVIDA